MFGITSIIIILYYFLILSYMLYMYGKYRICPEILWCFMQLLMFFGITHFIDVSVSSDKELILLYFLGLVTYIISCAVLLLSTKPQRELDIKSDYYKYKRRKPYMFFLIVVCMILCAWFFAQGGGNVFINGLRSMISGSDYSTKYSRMGLLSVSGVGYIYQLRVTILPLLVIYYVMFNKKKPLAYIISIVMMVFLIGTGQRGGLVSFMAITLLTIYYWMGTSSRSSKKKTGKRLYVYAGVLGVSMVLFGLSTILNGRVARGGTLFSAILKRILEDNQSCAVIGFRYIKTDSIQYGRDWMMQLIDILPGKNDYMSLDTRIFAFIHGGSTAGTSPACIWGSAYYNFGVFGIILLAIIIAMITTRIHIYYSKRKCDEFDVIIYSALQFLIAYWVASGPIVLFNNGFIATLLLGLLFTIVLRFRVTIGGKNYSVRKSSLGRVSK